MTNEEIVNKLDSLQNEIQELKNAILGIGVVQPQVSPVVVNRELQPFDYYIMSLAISGK